MEPDVDQYVREQMLPLKQSHTLQGWWEWAGTETDLSFEKVSLALMQRHQIQGSEL